MEIVQDKEYKECFSLWTGEIIRSPRKNRGPAYTAVEGTFKQQMFIRKI